MAPVADAPTYRGDVAPAPEVAPTPAEVTPALPLASPWARFGAGVVNWIILRVVFAVAAAIAGVQAGGIVGDLSVGGSVLILVYDVARFLYDPLFWAFAGATPGMMACGIRVVREDGQPLGLGTAFVRFLMVIVGAIPLFLGWLWMFWDPKRQGWHDKVAKTLVVRATRQR